MQEYMAKIGALYAEYSSTGSLAALTELQQLIAMRHDQEKLGEQFSCMGWALFAWNLEETQKLSPPPPQSHWKQALEGLGLSVEQQAGIVKARSSMIGKLRDIAASRADILARLGLQLLDYPREHLHLCPATQELRNSLEKERTAVYTFVVTVCDATLTAVQEAFLDAHSWPWCADLLQIADLLAAERGADDASPLPPDFMNIPGAALAPVLPHASAFRVLATPITAAGAGLRYKRGIVLNPVFTVEPSLAFPLPGQSLLQDMPLVSVHAGAWKQYTFWQWTTLVRKYGQPFPNPLANSSSTQPQPGEAPS